MNPTPEEKQNLINIIQTATPGQSVRLTFSPQPNVCTSVDITSDQLKSLLPSDTVSVEELDAIAMPLIIEHIDEETGTPMFMPVWKALMDRLDIRKKVG